MKFIRSYIIGIIMGICIGVSIGYMLSIAQELHQIGKSDDGEVVLAIAALRKLEKNDLASAKQMLRRVIATDYINHTKKKDSWLLGRAYRNSELVERVEKATKELPGLEQAINEEKAKTTSIDNRNHL